MTRVAATVPFLFVPRTVTLSPGWRFVTDEAELTVIAVPALVSTLTDDAVDGEVEDPPRSDRLPGSDPPPGSDRLPELDEAG